MIVKIQKPLTWLPEGSPRVLIYNRSHSVIHQVPYTMKWTAWFGHHLKRYARAYYRKGNLVIGNIVEDRDW